MLSLRSIRITLMTIVAAGLPTYASADVITLGGLITQSTIDGTGPAFNNPSLNAILDGDAYSVTIDFLGSVTSAGLHPLSLVKMSFDDPSAPANETSFSSASVTVSADGSLFDISILGCLSTGSGCGLGNQLDANFSIPTAGLDAHGVIAEAIPGLVPSMDLLEDDGSTDIQGTITSYSNTAASTVPEPSAAPLLSLFAVVFFYIAWLRQVARHGFESEIQKGEHA